MILGPAGFGDPEPDPVLVRGQVLRPELAQAEMKISIRRNRWKLKRMKSVGWLVV